MHDMAAPLSWAHVWSTRDCTCNLHDLLDAFTVTRPCNIPCLHLAAPDVMLPIALLLRSSATYMRVTTFLTSLTAA